MKAFISGLEGIIGRSVASVLRKSADNGNQDIEVVGTLQKGAANLDVTVDLACSSDWIVLDLHHSLLEASTIISALQKAVSWGQKVDTNFDSVYLGQNKSR